MKKIILVAASFLSLSAVAAFALPEVGYLEMGRDFETPSCSIVTPEANTIFAIPNEGNGMMKLNGQKVEFTLAEGAKSLWEYSAQDEDIATSYVYGDLILNISGKVTDACEPNEEGCEYTEMNFNATLTDGTESRDFTNLTGGCGV